VAGTCAVPVDVHWWSTVLCHATPFCGVVCRCF
jgi:hypothetical protein